jgi:hypothetical protein
VPGTWSAASSRPDLIARELRRRLLGGLRGRVIEVGSGDGRSFEFYPPAVNGILAVEPDPTARAAAEERARSARVPIEIVEGFAERVRMLACDRHASKSIRTRFASVRARYGLAPAPSPKKSRTLFLPSRR